MGVERQSGVRIGFVLFMFLCSSVLAEDVQHKLSIHFLSKPQAAVVMAESTAAAGYLDMLEIPEMAAKTGLPLLSMSVTEARTLTRKHFAEETQEFTEDERLMLDWAIHRIEPILAAKAPLYLGMPWNFVKVSDGIEGGLPHTRGESIVIPASWLRRWVAQYVAGDYERLAEFLCYLLVHEKTHILQRMQPAIFNTLVVDVMGFERVRPPFTSQRLAQKGVINPDAPVTEWVFPLKQAEKTGVLPYLILSNVSTPRMPRMPRDFRTIGVKMTWLNGTWKCEEDDGEPMYTPLSEIQPYVAAFPAGSPNYHPYEIVADMLGYWISGRNDGDSRHPMRRKVADWAAAALH